MATERTANQVPSLQLKSNAGDNADVIGWADPTTHRILTDATGSITNAGYSTVTSVSATNNTAGTAVQFASVTCKMVSVSVPTGNTSSQVAVGASTAKATAGSEVGLILISGATYDFYVTNADKLWFDVGTSGDKITYNTYA